MNLVEMRQRCGLTQEDAAKRLGWNRKAIIYLEQGRPQVVARRHFGRLAKLYKVTWDEVDQAVTKAQRLARRRARRAEGGRSS